MVPLSIFFVYAYSWNPYTLRNVATGTQTSQGYQGAIRAFMQMLNPKEIVDAIVFAFTMNSEKSRMARSRTLGNTSSPEYSLLEDHYQRRGG